MTDTAPKPPELPRRFYETASTAEADGHWRVLLDGRLVRTPGRAVLAATTRELADAIAQEWAMQGERIDPSSMPLTRLLNTAIDGVAPRLAETQGDLARYIETDLLFYRADSPERLVARQAEGWDPIIDWAGKRVGGPFHITSGIIHVAQPSETVRAFNVMARAIADPLTVAALHQMTTLTGSVILAFAVLEGRLDASTAFELAHIDEDWNIELWGDDEEAAQRRALRRADMVAAGRAIGLGAIGNQIPANQS
ncbi:Chaperone required for the assembly of the F1-ATPase [Aureimonas altamirensis DSM 21988]|uniref:Chaperone required for the assembly of the F1-ATPase n=1 Tax=Aureimonas altamirensis DSM 21988 TaxID=1121026 RepID=A0ABY1I4M2_9HYPH|nr:ATP12 family protein [Aureimonas altamirensis]SHI59628.1 Chaperone required for the assembly of the F1-ATPase [Aureimonas altamirensis DSM 21988]